VRRREQAEASRAALVAAARDCFAEQGYDATTVAEVLRRAGMARGALYHYFPGGKEELFGVVYDDVDALLHREVDRLDPSEPLEALSASLRVYLRLCTRDDFGRIVVLDADRRAGHGPGGGPAYGRSYDRVRSAVRAGVEAGELLPADVDVLATAVYGAARDLGARVARSAGTPSGRRRAAAQARIVLDHLLAGLARPSTAAPTATRSSTRTTSTTTSTASRTSSRTTRPTRTTTPGRTRATRERTSA
jgi:AcrR family transcriptional regulator